MDVWTYVLYFLKIVVYTIGTFCVCGLVVALCEWLFRKLIGGGAGYKAVIFTAIIGTPIHEIGHALMCLLFGHRITEICLWDPHCTDGNLGFVNHAYNPKNIYHRIGNLFIGLGPIFSGLGILTLIMFLVFPNTTSQYFSSAAEHIRMGEGIFSILLEGLKMIPAMITEGTRHIAIKIIAIIVMLSVSLHISLSPADIKGSADALPFYFGGVLIFTVITSLIGYTAMSAITSALSTFNAYLVMLFTVVFVFALALVLIALVVFILRKVLGMIFG